MNTAFDWSPILPLSYIALLAATAVAVFVLARWKKTPDFGWRALFFILLAALLMNPVAVHETRQLLPRKLVVVLDESPSEKIAGRHIAAEQILAHIQSSMPELEPVVIRAGLDATSMKNQNTSLFTALRDNLISIPAQQVAGTVLITDGQVHDVPDDPGPLAKLAPFNVVLTGKRNEFDRKVTVVNAPKYGLLSQDVTVKVKVEDTGTLTASPVSLTVKQDGKIVDEYTTTPGVEGDYTFKLTHPGQNVFEFSTAAVNGELTDINNTAAVIVNGIRDRLRVLLVSGMPHMGERAWRDLLKSDPAIDLVHFTILRSPTSYDAAPASEMSLIAFPVDELFERKIRDFDLIIFDKYAQYGLLQQQYFLNIASFGKQGGAFLMAMGSDKPEQSLFNTPLADILPVEPKPAEQSIITRSYVPQLTDLGKNHPVTADLQRDKKNWAPWANQVDVTQTKGQTLMTGADGKPLLIINQVSDGRVAVLASDNIWLWSKGVNGGGPYTDLLRHVAHWLMKEPELEEDYIKADVDGSTITVAERGTQDNVTMTRPDGQDETINLTIKDKGWSSAKIAAAQNGIYRFSNGKKEAFAVVGTATSAEFADVHTTDKILKPVVTKTRGTILWHTDPPRFTASDLRLKNDQAYAVTSLDSAPVLPNWLCLLLIAGGLVWVWRRESGR